MRLPTALIAVSAIAAALPALADPVPVSALAVPPASAQQFVIMSAAGKHGTSARWTTPDGTRMGRESMNLRGQIFEVDSAAGVGPDGMLKRVVVRGFTPNGDAAETFEIKNGQASWKSPVDASSAPYAAPRGIQQLSAAQWISTPTSSKPWSPRLGRTLDYAAGRQGPRRTANDAHRSAKGRRGKHDQRLRGHWLFKRAGP